jgi:hypothetical protein
VGSLLQPEQPNPTQRFECLGDEQEQPAANTNPGSPFESGQDVVAKWRAVRNVSAIATAR